MDKSEIKKKSAKRGLGKSSYIVLGILLVAVLLFGVFGDKDDHRTSKEGAKKKAMVLAAKKLCLDVVSLAAKDTSAQKLPEAVRSRFKKEICPNLTKESVEYWKCMKSGMAQGKGFYAVEKICKNDS